MNLGIKSITLRFDDNQLGYLQPVQGDTKSRGFLVEMVSTDGEVLDASTTYECRLYGVNSNYPDKTFYTVATVEEGRYKLYLSTDMVSKAGTLKLQVALYKGSEELIQSEVKEVEVTESMANGGSIGKDLVVDFTKLEKALERVDTQEKAYKDSLKKQEAIRVDVENKQKQVSTDTTTVEKIRTDMENIMSAEADRVEAEKKRVSQEKGRESAEKDRNSQENNRIEAERDRQNFELERAKAETARVSAENSRVEAEKDRQSQESTRENNEDKRKSAESARVSAEDTRQSQESTRQSQETQRVEAEKKRKSTFEGWNLAMQGVIPDATADTAGVVKVEGAKGETAPYSVPSVVTLGESLDEIYEEIFKKADKDKVMAKLPRLKIGQDTSKIPNDSYYIETNEVDFGGNLADKKILAICDRDSIKSDDIKNLKDKSSLLIGSKGDFVAETNVIATVSPTIEAKKYLEKDFSEYIIVFGTRFSEYDKYPQYFEFIKTITGSRNFVHVFDPEFKASLDETSYEDNISMMEMITEPEKEYKFIRVFRGRDILRYKDKDGKIH